MLNFQGACFSAVQLPIFRSYLPAFPFHEIWPPSCLPAFSKRAESLDLLILRIRKSRRWTTGNHAMIDQVLKSETLKKICMEFRSCQRIESERSSAEFCQLLVSQFLQVFFYLTYILFFQLHKNHPPKKKSTKV